MVAATPQPRQTASSDIIQPAFNSTSVAYLLAWALVGDLQAQSLAARIAHYCGSCFVGSHRFPGFGTECMSWEAALEADPTATNLAPT